MKVNLKQPLVNWNGHPVVVNDVKRDIGGFPVERVREDGIKAVDESGSALYETELVQVSLRETLSNILDQIEKEDTSETKNRLGLIQRMIWESPEVTFTPEQTELILARAGKYGSILTVHRLTELLAPEKLKQVEKQTKDA